MNLDITERERLRAATRPWLMYPAFVLIVGLGVLAAATGSVWWAFGALLVLVAYIIATYKVAERERPPT